MTEYLLFSQHLLAVAKIQICSVSGEAWKGRPSLVEDHASVSAGKYLTDMASGDIADWKGNKQQQVHGKMFIEKVDRYKL